MREERLVGSDFAGRSYVLMMEQKMREEVGRVWFKWQRRVATSASAEELFFRKPTAKSLAESLLLREPNKQTTSGTVWNTVMLTS